MLNLSQKCFFQSNFNKLTVIIDEKTCYFDISVSEFNVS